MDALYTFYGQKWFLTFRWVKIKDKKVNSDVDDIVSRDDRDGYKSDYNVASVNKQHAPSKYPAFRVVNISVD